MDGSNTSGRTGSGSPGIRADLVVSLLGGMVAWILHLGASYLLVPVVCEQGRLGLLHSVTGAAALLAAGAAWRGWSLRARLGPAPDPPGGSGMPRDPGPPRDAGALPRFLASFGLALSGFFFVLILVEGLPAALQPDPCGLVPTLDRPIILDGPSTGGLHTLGFRGGFEANPIQGGRP